MDIIVTDHIVLPDDIYGVIFNDVQTMYGIRALIQLSIVSKLVKKIINDIVLTINELDKNTMKFIRNDQLKMFKNLKVLDLSNNMIITDKGLEGLLLNKLNLYCNYLITDDAIKNMPIQHLNIGCNNKITRNFTH